MKKNLDDHTVPVNRKDGTSNITVGAPVYKDNAELAIGAYYGPRRPGGNYYNGILDTSGTRVTDYRTDKEFEVFADAGLNFVISENDAVYGYHYTATGAVKVQNFKESDLYQYMKTAARHGVEVIAFSHEMTRMLRGSEAFSAADQQELNSMVKNLRTMDNFKGILMADEPHYSYLENYTAVSKYLREIAPDAMLFTSCLPFYSNEVGDMIGGDETTKMEDRYINYISSYGRIFGSINYDFYPFLQEDSFGNKQYTLMRKEWFQNLEMAATVAHGNYNASITIQSMAHKPVNWDSKETSTHYREVTRADISFQMYSALAYGMKTISYYTYWDHFSQGDNEKYYSAMVMYPDTEGGEPVRTDVYYAVQAVNNEVKKFDHVLMDYTWQGTIGIAKSDSDGCLSRMSSYSSSRISSATATNDAIIGCLKDSNGYDGFMLVNATDPSDNKTSSVTLTFHHADRAVVYVNGVATDTALTNGSYTVSLSPGQGVFVIPYIQAEK